VKTPVQPCKKAPGVINVIVRKQSDATPVAGINVGLDGKPDQLTPSSGTLSFNVPAGSHSVSARVPKKNEQYILVRPDSSTRTVVVPPGGTQNVVYFVREYATLQVRVFFKDKDSGNKVYVDQIPITAKGKKCNLENSTAPPGGAAPCAPLTEWLDLPFDTYKLSSKIEGELLERYQPPADPVEKVIAAGSREKAELELLPRNLKLVKVDDHFAPSHENCDITYNILRLKDRDVKLSIVGFGDVLLYERLLTEAEKADGDGKVIQWDGKRNQDPKKDQYTTPIDGPLKVKLECGTVWKGELPFKILYHSIDLDWGVHTPDGNPPGIGEREKYAQYRLNVLGYDGGPVNGVIGTVTQNALRRFQRANYQTGTKLIPTLGR
jgi:hypothetical protein